MGGQTKIGGTGRQITGGKALVGGTARAISCGKTKIGGTAYTISFSALPAGYQQVKWLYNSGAQYINLPFTTQGGMTWEFELGKSSNVDVTGSTEYYGAIGYYASSGYYNVIVGLYGSNDSCTIYARQARSTRQTTISDVAHEDDVLYSGSVSFGPSASSGTLTLEYNGTTKTASGNGTLAGTGRNMRLFRSDGSSTTNYGGAHSMIGKFKAYDADGNVLCDMVPAVRTADNVAGMYDLESDTFYTNNGSGSFTAGPNA